ncbi:uncharacterized protein MONOS_15083 [Monocercomonoides exilis]|uniref:uncharacterized protein n=1 Tax=Monocercomonoides exilis TaxID=2049356 RepID=UPI00355A72D4|nr:hypothetical protein MONOS_15083 [Monocercomonoides exilis]|eukprot:MONOS_15083.1-p1 / transcript=MONOS_15083.1 / gene=MONOS_15083 / organism=Monocercomonoides_exilis_PA203 / gene_product=unspecified product / transcript_product=unspecified product / location=Mono_scaffold01139:13719-14419(+) / protein_length=178 / sequence_SO=supercontig / SO=protein_coding / is_pseudo=false
MGRDKQMSTFWNKGRETKRKKKTTKKKNSVVNDAMLSDVELLHAALQLECQFIEENAFNYFGFIWSKYWLVNVFVQSSLQEALRSRPHCTLSEFLRSRVLYSQAMAQLLSLLKISPTYHALLCECVNAASSVVADEMVVDFILTQKKSIEALERKTNKKEREEVDAPETICVEMLKD